MNAKRCGTGLLVAALGGMHVHACMPPSWSATNRSILTSPQSILPTVDSESPGLRSTVVPLHTVYGRAATDDVAFAKSLQLKLRDEL
jgi:hypothetical protein